MVETRLLIMSKAFTKEDVDPPERSGRVRSPSGLPPGAVNYMTAAGARRWRQELADLDADAEARGEILHLLESATVIEPDTEMPESVTFGAEVTVQDAADQEQTFRIVGVDEMEFWPDAVSWISPNGKALLAAELGGRLSLEDGRVVKIVRIQQPV